MAARHCLTKRLAASVVQTRTYSAPADRSIPAAKQKYVPTSGTYPKGFLAGSAFAGVKASNTKYDDLALVVSEQPCVANAVFTQNVFKAAPVTTSSATLRSRRNKGIRGVVVNSGCANAVTGKLGLEHAKAMAEATDKCFGKMSNVEGAAPETLVMSTGVIGQQLPIEKITNAIPKLHSNLGSTHEHWMNAAQAICTTDTFPKLLSRSFTLPSHPETTYSIAGMTKGAGMIHPNMATLLGIVCTDAKINPQTLSRMLRTSVPRSFNSISIDGDTSTNDTVAFFANGAAAPEDVKPLNWPRPPTREGRKQTEPPSPDVVAFNKVLTSFMTDLAKLVVRDGEGATKFVTIRVRSDLSVFAAKRVAESIATSSLVKTALYGKDANWGRILCAIGYAPGVMSKKHVPIDLNRDSLRSEGGPRNAVQPENTSVSFVPADGSEELKLLVRGEPEQVDEERAKQILEMEDLEILVRLDDYEAEDRGRSYEAEFWTCDFSHEYVTINGDYRT